MTGSAAGDSLSVLWRETIALATLGVEKGLGLTICTPESLNSACSDEKCAFREGTTAAARITAAVMASKVSTFSIRESSLAAVSDRRSTFTP